MKEGNTIYFYFKTGRRWLVNPSGNKLFSFQEDEKGTIKDSQRGLALNLPEEEASLINDLTLLPIIRKN